MGGGEEGGTACLLASPPPRCPGSCMRAHINAPPPRTPTPPPRFADEYSPVCLSALSRAKVDIERLEEGDLDYASSVSGLARLRGRLKLAIANFQGCCCEYTNYVGKALELEAVCKARQLGVYSPPPGGQRGRGAAAAWYYKCVLRPWVLRGAAAASAAASAVVVWSEITIGSGRSPDLSPFSLLIHSGTKYDEFLEQLLVAAPLAYMCACAYFSLFKLGNFGFYHVVSGATWAYSLLLSGSLLARFAAPLCFNFLHVIRMNEYLEDGEVSQGVCERGGGGEGRGEVVWV